MREEDSERRLESKAAKSPGLVCEEDNERILERKATMAGLVCEEAANEG